MYDALMSMDAARLEALGHSGSPATPVERRRAEERFAAALLAGEIDQDPRAQVWHVLFTRQWESPPTFEQLFDDLTPERAARLGELYEALPEGARAEYDRRYEPPGPAAGERGSPGALRGAPAAEAARWRAARTLGDLGELTVQWLEGTLSRTPGYAGTPAPETNALVPVLTAVNRAGFVTHRSQPGGPAGEDGRERRAAVCGFADDQSFSRLMAVVAESGLVITAARAGDADRPPVLPVSRDGHGREHASDGGSDGPGILRNGYEQACHPRAAAALREAWLITVIDPRWGCNDVLWPALERFAGT